MNKITSIEVQPEIDREGKAPVVFCDTVPGGCFNVAQQIADLTLATSLPEHRRNGIQRRVVVAADLKLTIPAAKSLRELLDKIILAATPNSNPN